MNGTSPSPQAEPTGSDPRVAALVEENDRLRLAVSARDSFLAVAAHELRNPMTPILGRVTVLRRAVARAALTPAELDTRLAAIESAIVHFIKRATTLLDVSRIASGRAQVERMPVDVAQMAAQIAENLTPAATHAGASLAFVAFVADEPQGIVASADPMAVEQVLENLVFNAIKYGNGSPITITVSADRARGVASIAVTDQGPGISETNRARIFERFERAVEAGSTTGYGIGLWLVRNLCEAMDGDIEVTSSPGAGSTFAVSLPLHTP